MTTEKKTLKFQDKFLKAIKKSSDTITDSSEPPRYWYSTGNYVLNRIMSGSYYNGIPQGRITILGGLSGAGKSYLSMNLVKQAQAKGAICLVIDSENALDDGFVQRVGIDTEDGYIYVSVVTIDDALLTVSQFLKEYKAEYGESKDAPEVLILIDSLTMLLTTTEKENYDKGNNKGTQGQKQKQLKSMLAGITQDIKFLNVTVVATTQVYKNPDMIMNPVGPIIVSDAIQYACSQILTLSKRKMKGTDGKFNGVRIIADGFKTRFTVIGQKVEIEVPYDTGMDPYSGLLDAAKSAGVVKQAGAWYSINDTKFQSKDIASVADDILQALTESEVDLGNAIEMDVIEEDDILDD